VFKNVLRKCFTAKVESREEKIYSFFAASNLCG
jgi:hypothetical protein